MTTENPRRAGVRQVAQRAGVALSSVSRVLSGHPDVSDVMRHRVMDAVAALGYEPDLLAQSLRRGASMTVGYVVGDIANPLSAQIAHGAETALRRSGYSLLLVNSTNDPDLDAQHIRLLRQRRTDGLLLALADEKHPDTIAELLRYPGPYVLVDRACGQLPLASGVHSDHRAGLTEAVEHLYRLGHRHIALINGNPRVLPARERASVLRRFARGVADLETTVRSGAFTAQHGEAAAAALINQDAGRPTAIIAGGNQILPGVLRALRAAGLTVPTDVSLVTCDHVALAEFLRPPLATVSRDLNSMGETAAALLLERLSGKDPRRVTLPTGFRAEQSCAPPRRRPR
jgi:LacI family transcriptional regulator